MQVTENVDQGCLNLRWFLSQRNPNPIVWASDLNTLTETTLAKSIGGYDEILTLLAKGFEALQNSKRVAAYDIVAETFGVEVEELKLVPLYLRNATMLQRNVTYLVDSIPHGQMTSNAKKLRLSRWQLTRWGSGKIIPRKGNLRKLLQLHGIDPDIDLEVTPLFLLMEPLSGFVQRDWVIGRIEALPASVIADLYPALKKLLRYDD